MNWGTKIILGLGAFMLFIIGSSIYMVSKDSDTLIDDDYYEKGLAYDQVYDRKQNLQDDRARPKLKIDKDTLSITFITKENKGELVFKRPSDGSLDKKLPFYTATEVLKLPVSSLERGNWSLEINWTNQDKQYIDNQSLFVQ